MRIKENVGQLSVENLALIINMYITATWIIPKPFKSVLLSPFLNPRWEVLGGQREAILMLLLFSRTTLEFGFFRHLRCLPRDCCAAASVEGHT